MTATHKNRLVTTISAVASAGLGAFTVDAASSGSRTFGAGDDGLTFDGITITEGATWERRDGCVYTHSGTSLARGTLMDSSTGSAITFTAAAIVTQGAGAELANKTEMLLDVFGATEVSVTTTATATIGRMHHCTGTSADYTVTLPAASGNAGKLIGFRMGSASALTKLVTIDGNASETIDGTATRIMWATETAILLCDGTGWHKIAGKTVPLTCNLNRTTDQSISSATWTACSFTSQVSGYAAMYDAGNSRVKIVRPGNYLVVTYSPWSGSSISNSFAGAAVNGADASGHVFGVSASTNAYASVPWMFTCALNDYINSCLYVTGTSPKFVGASTPNILATEIPAW